MLYMIFLKVRTFRQRGKSKRNIHLLFLILAIAVFLEQPTPLQAFCFEEAGIYYDIAPQILWAIAKEESGFNPNAVNYNPNGTYDFGLMQINSSWYRKLGPGIWSTLSEPCTNVKVGAWILSKCISTYGYTWRAVGCYNSPGRVKASRYADKIYKILSTYK